jgi:hypothetical protein
MLSHAVAVAVAVAASELTEPFGADFGLAAINKNTGFI